MPGSTRIGGLFSTLTAAFVLQLLSCAESEVAPPELSGLTVHLSVSGLNATEGSLISVDGAVPQALSRNGELVFRSIASGTHVVAISGFAENCSLDGPNQIVVTAPPSGMARVEFRITCTATTGVIAVVVMSSGTLEPVSFSLQVDTAPARQIWSNQKTSVGSFAVGAHVVTVVDVPPSCNVIGDASTSVSITAGRVTQDTVLASLEVLIGHLTQSYRP